MGRSPPSRPGRIRRCLRLARRGLVVAAVILGAVLLYYQQAGLPDFVRERVVRELRARGVNLQLGQLSFRWYRGLVAEDVALGPAGGPTDPEILIPELVVRLDLARLLRLRFDVQALDIRQGQVVLPLPVPDQPLQRLRVEDISAGLRFLPGDQWMLDHCTARCLGARLHLSGQLTNASRLAWRRPAGEPGPPVPWQAPLRRLARQMESLRFDPEPELHLDVQGDAANPTGLSVSVRLNAKQASTEWGRLGRLLLTARLNEPGPVQGLGRSRVVLEARQASTPWAEVDTATLEVDWTQSWTQSLPEAVDWRLQLDGVRSRWGQTPRLRLAATGGRSATRPDQLESEVRLFAGRLSSDVAQSRDQYLTARLVHDTTSLIPRSGDLEMRIRQPRLGGGRAEELRVTGTLERHPNPPQAHPDWAWWALLAPFRLRAEATLSTLNLSNLVVDRVLSRVRWDAPRIDVESLEVDLFSRRLRATASVDVTDRRLRSDLALDFDVRRLAPLLPEATLRWLERYQWTPEEPPGVQAQVGLTLPPWNSAAPDWRAAFGPGLSLDGTVAATNASFRGLAMDRVRFHFHFTNHVWRLAGFEAEAPAGRVVFDYQEDQRTSEYRFDLRARMDPRALKPLVPEAQRRGFDLFEFGEPPAVDGWVVGRWREGSRVGFSGTVQAPRFVFRGEPIDQLEAQLDFTNAVLEATAVRLRQESGVITADRVRFDTARQWLTLGNATSTLVPPERIARTIGTKVAEILAPYRFLEPPVARVNGQLNVRDTREADLVFDVNGGPFHFWRFRVPAIQARVHWQNQGVLVTNLTADFYEGRLDTGLQVDFSRGANAEIAFTARTTNVNFQPLMTDLLQQTNRLEGRLSGEWIVTSALSDDWNSWQGRGRAELRDGYLLDIPLVGLLSDVLDNMVPGVGRSKVTGLTGTFAMTNSILHSTDAELRSPAMRLLFNGWADFDARIDARVEARLLKDAALIGPLVSTLFLPLTKLLEYQVTGTIGEPRLEPLYIPKPLLFPLNPIGTLRDMFGPKPKPKPPTAGEKP